MSRLNRTNVNANLGTLAVLEQSVSMVVFDQAHLQETILGEQQLQQQVQQQFVDELQKTPKIILKYNRR